MTAAGNVWRWGVVVPVTVAALAGATADVVTGTLTYWWLLAPSYPVIGVATWRMFDPERQRAQQRAAHEARIAELDEEIAKLDAEIAENAAKQAAEDAKHGVKRPAPTAAAAESDDLTQEEGDDEDRDDDLDRDDEPARDDPLITNPPHVTVGSVAGHAIGGFVRLVLTVAMTFIFMVLIWMAIDIATWARPFWYVYVPVFIAMAALALWFWRYEVTHAEAGRGVVKNRDPLVR